MPSPNLANVIVGPATLYTGAANSDVLPANSVALGGSWGGTWVYSGATDSGVAWNVTQNTQDITIEEQPNPAAVTVLTMDVSVSVTLAEDTIENMKISFGGTLTVNAGATPPNKVLTFNTNVNNYALGFEGLGATAGKPRRVYIPNVVSISQAQVPYRRAAEKRMYAVTFRAICAPSSITVTEITG